MSSKPTKYLPIRRSIPDTECREAPPESKLDYEDKLVDLMDEIAMFKALRPEMRKALLSKDIKGMLKETSTWAMAKMIYLAQYATTDAVRKEALKDILDRAGWKPPEKSIIANTSDLTDSELDAKIISKMKELGVDNEGSSEEAKPGVEGRPAGSSGTQEQKPTKK